MEDIVVKQLFAIVVIVLAFILVAAFYGTRYLPFGANYNNLCENRWTAAADPNLNNRLEQEFFPAKMTDCCYNRDTAQEVCEYYISFTNEPLSLCADRTQNNPRNFFHCQESTHLTGDSDCEEENCIENCNFNDICEDNQNESPLCYDCWGLV
jgi:hypothetical protein